MYRGFKIEPINFENETHYYEVGEKMYSSYESQTRQKLKEFIFSDNPIDGTKLQQEWFPEFDANIFISHSHKDKKMAIALSGWLKENFKITSFIDSCIWGYSDDLLKEIDDDYCLKDNRGGNKIYNYNTRNQSTSHVHMMLSSALSLMIDKTECLFFLNTPHSIIPINGIENTESPWIYFEIGVSQIVRKEAPSRLLVESERHFGIRAEINTEIEKALKVNYKADLSHLTKLTSDDLNKWLGKGFDSALDALDVLYKFNPAKLISDSLFNIQ